MTRASRAAQLGLLDPSGGSPAGVILSHADVPSDDRTWVGPVLVTRPGRTIADCIEAGVAPEIWWPRRSPRQRGAAWLIPGGIPA